MIHLGLQLSRSAPTAEKPDVSTRAPAVRLTSPDEAILAALDRVVPGETIAMSFARREVELRALFDGMSPEVSRCLARRLASKVCGDPVVDRFARLVPERRQRLLSYLEDARRRVAVRSGRP